MMLDHTRVGLQTGQTIILPPEAFEKVRQKLEANVLQSPKLELEDAFGGRVMFDIRQVVFLGSWSDGAVQEMANWHEEFSDRMGGDDEPWSP